MYVEDMTLSQALEWERKLQSDLRTTALSASHREQARMDLQDVQSHITGLSSAR